MRVVILSEEGADVLEKSGKYDAHVRLEDLPGRAGGS